ncbi:MAG: hypothetical protein FWE06_07095 [Oscillospiraceae bacterium]|nr:hypothetical protein [Oscillospiraceae bacterium]
MKRIVLLLSICLVVSLTGCAAGDEAGSDVAELRDFPYSYRAMLAISSDIDAATPEQFTAYHQFLNTREMTDMGLGLGLDIADSFWMYMASDLPLVADRHGNGSEAVMSWFVGTSDVVKDAEMIVHYWEKGWIDSIHTWGDFTRVDESEHLFSREMAERGVAALREHGIYPTVWINHGNAANTQNIETRGVESYRSGDRPGTDAFHTDITIPLGIKFIWGSHNDTSFGRHDILYPTTLHDGQTLWGFHRYTPGWSIYGLHEQLSDANLDLLVENRLPVVVSQHFGGANYYFPFISSAVEGLQRLAERYERGDILVTRTSRLLEYLRVRDHLAYEASGRNIDITAIDDPQLGLDSNPAIDSLRGMTFYVDNAARWTISINGQPLAEELLVRTGNRTEQDTIGVAWFERN